MHIAMLHYHLRPGGVTRVLSNAVKALAQHGVRTVVLVGEKPVDSELWPCLKILPELGYDNGRRAAGIAELAAALEKAAVDALGHQPDLWHVHNHALGKNLALPGAIKQLAEDHHKLLIQVHDFAEDGRPSNYNGILQAFGKGDEKDLGSILYPLGTHVHYAVLNSRDAGFLQAAGLPKEQLHILQNPAWLGGSTAELKGEVLGKRPRSYLYPTRAIRRKNLGEFLLWACVAEEGDRFATTLAPENPSALLRYGAWIEFAQKLKLPVEFEVGRGGGRSYGEMIHAYDAVVTTSVAEGFGLAFLEPWLLSRPLLGRDLPEITSDFKETGLALNALYRELNVPIEWVGRSVLRNRIRIALEQYYVAYGRRVSGKLLDEAAEALTGDDHIDFARLDEDSQRIVISMLQRDPFLKQHILPDDLWAAAVHEETIKKNRELAETHFNLEKYGEQLLGIYRLLLDSTASSVEGLSSKVIIDKFMDPQRFYLLRT